MRNGIKVFDADTHIRPSSEFLRPQLSEQVLKGVPDLDEHREEIHIGDAGGKRKRPYRHWYRLARMEGWGRSSRRARSAVARE